MGEAVVIGLVLAAIGLGFTILGNYIIRGIDYCIDRYSLNRKGVY